MATQAHLPLGLVSGALHGILCAPLALVSWNGADATVCDLCGVLPTSRTPCFGRLYDALPVESRTARVKLVLPQGASPDTDLVVHLAGTGDHGFERRLHLGFPLIKQVLAPRLQDLRACPHKKRPVWQELPSPLVRQRTSWCLLCLRLQCLKPSPGMRSRDLMLYLRPWETAATPSGACSRAAPPSQRQAVGMPPVRSAMFESPSP